MTDIFEKIQNDFNEFMKQAKELIEKERVDNATKTKRWKPKVDDIFYYIADNGCVMSLKTDDYISDYVENLYDFYNIFETEGEAQKELERRFAEQELSSYCDFDGVVELCYDEHAECFEADDCSELPYHHSPYRFSSKESCEKAIKRLGEDKLKLIYRID